MALDAPRVLELAVHGPIARGDLPGLSRRVCGLLETSAADIVLCDVRDIEPDAVTVEALSRLQLAARRHRCRVVVRDASAELRALIEFMGLDEVLASTPRDAAAARTAGTPAPYRGRR
jgi:ABC-type transporter Mla MlaB component